MAMGWGAALSGVVLCGAGGLLGSAFAAALGSDGHLGLPRSVLDAADPSAIARHLESARAGTVINCVAHTNLEAAEADPSADRHANERIPQALAAACKATGAVLVHFSSTGCYGSSQTGPYTEADALQPSSQHHKAKAAGEEHVRASGCEHLVLRTGWLYGGAPTQPKNFVWKRMVEASRAARMTSDAAQRGCPTHVDDVVAQVRLMLDEAVRGTFNVTAHGAASRFEYVAAIVRFAGLPCEVVPGPGFKRLAPVSMNETSINARLQEAGLDVMTDWRTSLRRYTLTLLQSPMWRSLGTPQP